MTSQVAVSAAVDVSPGKKIAQSADLSTVMIDLGERARDEVRGRAAREVHRHLPGMTVGEGLIYYPLAQNARDFPAEMEKKMPGVAAAVPRVATAIEKWQPYQPGVELRDLNQLAREQKHNRLTLQLVRDTTWCRVTEDATGASVEWYGLAFRPGLIRGLL